MCVVLKTETNPGGHGVEFAGTLLGFDDFVSEFCSSSPPPPPPPPPPLPGFWLCAGVFMAYALWPTSPVPKCVCVLQINRLVLSCARC